MSEAEFKIVCEKRGIKVRAYSDPKIAAIMKELQLTTGCSGYAIDTESGPVILYDDRRTKQDIQFTIAHELGHILLGHLSYRHSVKDKMPEFAEREADAFAVSFIIHSFLYGEAGVRHG